MTDRATLIFLEELTKESAPVLPGQSGVRKRPPGMVPDEGIIQQQKATQRKNVGTLAFDARPDTQKLKDKRVETVQPGQPESPWRATKISEDRQFLLDPDVSPIEYANAMTKAYGKEWLSWEPETLWETIRKDWQTYPNPEGKNKLMAIKALMANDYFWQEWEVFEKVCSAFNDRIPHFGRMEDLSVAELALGVQLASQLKRRSFDNEVKAYVASRAHEDGYVMLPEVLSFAQDYLDTLMQGTSGPEVRDRLSEIDPLKLEVSSDTDPVHVQAGLLQAVDVYLRSRNTAEVKA